MKLNTTQKVVLSGLVAALIFVMTAFLPFPLPGGGYANLGDCFVILSGILLGPIYGSLAAAIGSCFSDLFLGFGIYAPATFIIKGVMAFVVSLILGNSSPTFKFGRLILASVLAEIIMIFGYFLFEIPLYGLPGAVADIIGNSVQGVVGAVSAVILITILYKTKIIQKINK
jgi:uncharacterized membrane protein